MINDTIVALATSRGRGAISIVRISGSDSLIIAKKLTKKERGLIEKIYEKDFELYEASKKWKS